MPMPPRAVVYRYRGWEIVRGDGAWQARHPVYSEQVAAKTLAEAAVSIDRIVDSRVPPAHQGVLVQKSGKS